MPLLNKTPDITLSYSEIDHDHDVFITIVNQMQTADQATFISLFNQLMEHTQQHFERENVLMEQFGFPAIQEHQGEHHRVLVELMQFKRFIDKGHIAVGKSYIEERLPQWFVLHVTTMDAALDAHIKRMTL